MYIYFKGFSFVAKTLKNKVNPKHIRKPSVGTVCNVILPAANLLGG